MTTHADFYDAPGPTARWLGSLDGHADPASILATPPGRLALDATDPMSFADAVADLLDVWADEHLGDAYHPAEGWRQPDQRHADWIYSFHGGRVLITHARSATAADDPVDPADSAAR